MRMQHILKRNMTQQEYDNFKTWYEQCDINYVSYMLNNIIENNIVQKKIFNIQ